MISSGIFCFAVDGVRLANDEIEELKIAEKPDVIAMRSMLVGD